MQNCFVFVEARDESFCVWMRRDLTFAFLFSMFIFSSARFINARRRIVQPMIDQSNRAGKKKGKDKQKFQNEKTQTDNPANLQ